MFRRRRVASAPKSTSAWPFVGMSLMAADFFLYAASGLVAPAWGVAALLAIWFVLFVLCCRWWTPHPKRLVFVAVAAMVFWFCALTAGAVWLDWGA
jgi:hypothetical protein